MGGIGTRLKRRSIGALLDAGIVAALVYVAYQVGRHEPATEKASDTAAAALEAGRGRLAEKPSQFNGTAWKDILLRTYNEALDDRITTVAGGIAFFGLLAVFPAVAAVVSLYGLVADAATVNDHLATLSFLLPPNAFSVIEEQITRITAQGGTALGLKFAFGLCLALWSANAATKALLDGLNIAYEEREKRSFLWLNLISLALTLAGVAAVLLLLAFAAVLPGLLDWTGASAVESGLALLRWPAMLVLLILGLAAVYRYGPSRKEPRWRWVTWGSLLAAVLVMLISVLLSWYLTNLADYTKTYGSLGAAIALMTWMWLSACAVLAGAELNAEMEHQTARDSTIGAPKPMGLRGARMADTLGASTD